MTKDTPQGPLVTGALWMSILRGRSVYDGAFVSMDPADPRVGPTSDQDPDQDQDPAPNPNPSPHPNPDRNQVGVPLDMHDAGSKYGAFEP